MTADGQLAVVEFRVARVHEVRLKVPVPLLFRLTVPVGVVGVPDVSFTVTAQLVGCLSATAVGVHERVVAVECNALICTDALPVLAA